MKANHKLLLIAFAFMLSVVLFCACESTSHQTTALSSSTTAPTSTTPIPFGTTTEPAMLTTPTVTTTPAVTKERPTDEETLAVQMVETLFEQYGVKGGSGDNAFLNFTEYHNTAQSGYLWTNFSAVGMQYYMCKLYPDDETQKETFRLMINNFRYYRQRNPERNEAENSVKYHSGRGNLLSGGSGDCFFDDNIWVARNYLRAYEILGDSWYLEEAIRVNNWVLSGWNDELGGVVWSEVGLTDAANEQHLERGLSANACAILVNAQLYELTEDAEEKEFYLDWAQRFYQFCKKMQNTPASYDYWNGIHTVIVNGVRKDGEVNRVHYSYNSGSMILANLALYDITENKLLKANYLKDAVETAKAAQKTFCMTDASRQTVYYQGDPWFAAILHEAFYELYQYDKAVAAPFLETFSQNVQTAYQNRDRETGLCPYQATQTVTWTKNESWCIHQIGYAEQAVLSALYSLVSED